MPYDDRLPLHAPIRRPWLHPLRRHAVRSSIRAICEFLEIASPDAVFDETQWLARPEWSGAGLAGGSDDSWITWHRRRAGVELAAWRWATQLPDWTAGVYDHAPRNVTFTRGGRFHREIGPALIGRTRLEWYRDEVPHRTDGPARIDASAGVFFLQEGRLHRTDGPAEISRDGGVAWYRDGRRHRTDGPAVSGGAAAGRQWWVDGALHRVDGPAVITHACPECTGVCRQWYRDGVRHRDGGPAIIHADGVQEWYRHDVRHRDDGPALERPWGRSEWWRGGAPVNILDERATPHGAASLAEELFV